jgi:hypothetical protein
MRNTVIARRYDEAIQAQATTRQPTGLHRLCLDCFTPFAMTEECKHSEAIQIQATT